MMDFIPYIQFDGNCAEAFSFYAELLDGEVDFMMTYADGPDDMPVPEEAKNKVMHAQANFGTAMMMGTDAVTMPYTKPAGITVSLQIDDVVEAQRIFAGLAEGGTIGMALEETFFALAFGAVTDRFGVPWQVNVNRPD